MTYDAQTVDEYIQLLPEDRRELFSRLREVINRNMPDGFEETISYRMPSWVVPHTLYPDGYHCNPEEPLPFLAAAAQKHYIGLYHMGIYARPDLLRWFRDSWAALDIGVLDMGKSCIRLKKPDRIPFGLIGQLVSRMKPEDWIALYEREIRPRRGPGRSS